MPFSGSTPITINVTSADISAASTTESSLVVAMKRLNAALQLDGETPGDDTSGYYFATSLNPRYNNGQLLSLFDVFCATTSYTADGNTQTTLAGELLGLKPTSSYTATLVHS